MKNKTYTALLALIVLAFILLSLSCNGVDPKKDNTNKNATKKPTTTVTEEPLVGPPTCNEATILAKIKKDKLFEKSIDNGDLDVTFNAVTNTLSVKGKISGKTGSLKRFQGILNQFQGKRPPNDAKCIMKVLYGNTAFEWEWCPYECDGVCSQTDCEPVATPTP